MKVLVDTNVILDFFLSRNPQKEATTELFMAIYQERINAFTTCIPKNT
jgi:predicted nucleic acid-binding protein